MASNIKFPTMLTGVLETHHMCVIVLLDILIGNLIYPTSLRLKIVLRAFYILLVGVLKLRER